MGDYLTHTVSGNIASFKSVDIMPIESLKCHFLPILEGSGDPSPENIREIRGWNNINSTITGKNLLGGAALKNAIQKLMPITSINNNVVVYTNADAANHNGEILFNHFKPNTQYTFIVTYSKDVNRYIHLRFDYSDGTYSMMSRGAGITPTDKTTEAFVSTANKTVVSIARLADEYSTVTLYCDESGLFEGNISIELFELYNGQTIPITFPTLGKNLFNKDNPQVVGNCWMNTTAIAASGTDRVIYVPCCPNTTYTISKSIGDVLAGGYTTELPIIGMMHHGYYRDGLARKVTITTGKQAKYLVVWCYDASKTTDKTLTPEDIYNTLLIEYGDTATEYTSYNSNNTVYGGYIDIAKKELVLEWNYIIINKIQNKSEADDGYFWWTTTTYSQIPSIAAISNSSNCYVNRLKTASNVGNSSADGNFLFSSNGIIRWKETNTSTMTKEEYSEYIAENPFYVCYKLATPITYLLASLELKTFFNQNNIWSNTNDITEVTYTFQDHLLQLRMSVKLPHIESVTSDFTTGTFAKFTTDLKAPLSSVKISFLPRQSGEGDASLTNIRTINGWTGCNLGINNFCLPSAYLEVEYIQSNSIYSYFITDYYPNSKTEYYIKIHQGNSYTNEYYPTAFSAGPLFELYKNGYYSWTLKRGSITKGSSGYNVNRNLIEISMKNTIYKIIPNNSTDVLTYTIALSEPFQSENPLIILAREVNGEIRDNKIGDPYPKLYRLTFFEEGLKVRDYIPCYRKSDNEPGLYDIINNTFLTKSGEGTFSTGPVITITGSLIPIDWSSYNTFYGGYIDIAKGELVLTYYKIIADGINIKANSSYMTNDYIAAGIVYLLPLGLSSSNYHEKINVFMDKIPIYCSYNVTSSLSLPYAICTNAGSLYIIFRLAKREDYPEVTDATTCKAFVNNWLLNNPVTIVYELATPIVHLLTPIQLKSLIGTNNIWSNTNSNIEIKYWKH